MVSAQVASVCRTEAGKRGLLAFSGVRHRMHLASCRFCIRDGAKSVEFVVVPDIANRLLLNPSNCLTLLPRSFYFPPQREAEKQHEQQ